MLKRFFLSSINIYKKIFSPDHGIFQRPYKGCRFYPSCSEYTYLSIEKYGAGRGAWLGIKRIARCHPWSEGGIDLVE